LGFIRKLPLAAGEEVDELFHKLIKLIEKNKPGVISLIISEKIKKLKILKYYMRQVIT
jgi:hypothetical protein